VFSSTLTIDKALLDFPRSLAVISLSFRGRTLTYTLKASLEKSSNSSALWMGKVFCGVEDAWLV
jgi:hypothetical protein